MHAIKTEAELRAVIGAEPPGLAEENQPRLNGFAMDFIAKSFIRSELWRPETRGARHEVSFGKMFAAARNAPTEAAAAIDEAVNADYRDHL